MNAGPFLLIFCLLVTGSWYLGRWLGRWIPVLRHVPWMVLIGLGLWHLYMVSQQDPGSTMGSGLGYLAGMILGGLFLVSGILVGALTWLFPGKVRRIPVQTRGKSSVHGLPPNKPTEKARTFALLQTSLHSEISTEILVQATRSVSSLHEADTRMSKARLGILFRGLGEADAARMAGELSERGVPVQSVEENRLFSLPVGRRARALRLESNALVETDGVGREHRHEFEHLLRCSGGRVDDVVYREHTQVKTRVVRNIRGQAWVEPFEEKSRGMESLSSLRIEFLLPTDPYRIIWTCDPSNRRLLQNTPVGPENTDEFDAFLLELRKRIAGDRLNLGIQRAGQIPPWVYPTLRAFEEETVWALTCWRLEKEERTS